jgi:hypothetical protein
MESTVPESHRAVYRELFQHPAPRNLQWREVASLLRSISDVQVEETPHGDMKLVRNGRSLVVHPPKHKDFDDIEQVMQLRHFLDSTGSGADVGSAGDSPVVIVIDHHEARIYHADLDGTVPKRIVPYDPFGFGRHTRPHADGLNGKRPRELKSYYEAIVKTIQNAKMILIFGEGVGGSSAMDELVLELKQRHPDLAQKVVHTVRVDEHHLTEDQLLSKSREFLSTRAAQS